MRYLGAGTSLVCGVLAQGTPFAIFSWFVLVQRAQLAKGFMHGPRGCPLSGRNRLLGRSPLGKPMGAPAGRRTHRPTLTL